MSFDHQLGWDIYELDNVCDVIDSLHKTPVYSNFGYPMIRVKDLCEGYFDIAETAYVGKEIYEAFTKNYKPKFGDIIFSRVGSYGITSYVYTNQKFCLGQNTVGITNFKSYIDNQYVYYQMISPLIKNQIESLVTGSTQKTISMKSIKSLRLVLPKYREQRAISNVLSRLDEKIEVNNRINKTLKNIAQEIFKRWFVDFEFPNVDGEPYKSSGGGMVESELGMIPKGWEVGTINNLGRVVGGSTPSKKKEEYYTTDGISWITPKDLSNNKNIYINKGMIDISKEGFRNSSTIILPKNSILFSSRAPIGYMAIADAELTTNQGFKSVIPDKRFGTYFVYCSIIQMMERIISRASGSTFLEVSGSVMKSIDTLLPEKDIILKFNNLSYKLFGTIKINEAQNRILTSSRDKLLPKLMSGEIRVPIEELKN